MQKCLKSVTVKGFRDRDSKCAKCVFLHSFLRNELCFFEKGYPDDKVERPEKLYKNAWKGYHQRVLRGIEVNCINCIKNTLCFQNYVYKG